MKKYSKASVLFSAVSLILSLLAWTLWPYFQGSGVNYHSKMDALGYLFAVLTAFCLSPKNIVLQISLALLLVRVADEFLFNPFEQETKEYWLAAMLVSCVITYNLSYYFTHKQK